MLALRGGPDVVHIPTVHVGYLRRRAAQHVAGQVRPDAIPTPATSEMPVVAEGLGHNKGP